MQVLRSKSIKVKKNLHTSCYRLLQAFDNIFSGFIISKNVKLQVDRILGFVNQAGQQREIIFAASYKLNFVAGGVTAVFNTPK